MVSILKVQHLKKSFSNNQVIQDVSLTVEKGQIYGLIGQNGAGKTTIMNMILGQLEPDEGEVLVNGLKVINGGETTNQLIGYAPDVPNFYGYMNGVEYLTFCAAITSMPKKIAQQQIDQLLLKVGLATKKKLKISNYSRGMKQRLGIAQALLNKPLLLICDEPTSALDPQGRKELIDLLVTLKREMAVILSTHILSDVEKMCDKVGILYDGKIRRQGTINELMASQHEVVTYVIEFEEAAAFTRYLEGSSEHLVTSDVQSLTAVSRETMPALLKRLADGDYSPKAIVKEHQSLETIFLEVTNGCKP